MDEFDVIHIGHRYKLNIKQMKLSDDFIFHHWCTLILGGKKKSILDNETMNKISNIVNKLCTAVLLKGELHFEDYCDNYTYYIIKSKGLYFSSIPIAQSQISGDYLTLLRLFEEILGIED